MFISSAIETYIAILSGGVAFKNKNKRIKLKSLPITIFHSISLTPPYQIPSRDHKTTCGKCFKEEMGNGKKHYKTTAHLIPYINL